MLFPAPLFASPYRSVLARLQISDDSPTLRSSHWVRCSSSSYLGLHATGTPDEDDLNELATNLPLSVQGMGARVRRAKDGCIRP